MPRNTVIARLRRSIVASSRRPMRRPSLLLGTVVELVGHQPRRLAPGHSLRPARRSTRNNGRGHRICRERAHRDRIRFRRSGHPERSRRGEASPRSHPRQRRSRLRRVSLILPKPGRKQFDEGDDRLFPAGCARPLATGGGASLANSGERVSGTQICKSRIPCARMRARCAETLARVAFLRLAADGIEASSVRLHVT